MSDWERFGQAVDIAVGRAAVRERPGHLSRGDIRRSILLNPDTDLWVVQTEQMFIAGLGRRDLTELMKAGVQFEPSIMPVLMEGYQHYKWLVEQFPGQFVAVPPGGYSLMHTVEYDADTQQLTVSTDIVDLVYPWYEVDHDEKYRLVQMSLAICRAAGLAPRVVHSNTLKSVP